MKTLTLPGGTVLNEMDVINARDSLGVNKKGKIATFKDLGQHGWMLVYFEKENEYDWLSVAVQLEHIGEKNILPKKMKAVK